MVCERPNPSSIQPSGSLQKVRPERAVNDNFPDKEFANNATKFGSQVQK
jgi:hypothetical protein